VAEDQTKKGQLATKALAKGGLQTMTIGELKAAVAALKAKGVRPARPRRGAARAEDACRVEWARVTAGRS
jgi:hypothetical protein